MSFMLFSSFAFHSYHLISFLTSVLAYLFSTFINSSAVRYGFSFTQIGLLNLVWSLVYAVSSISLGHIGDRSGYKSAMRVLYLYALLVSILGFFTNNARRLFVFSILQGAFFGAFFPQIEGLIARSEREVGINPPSITGRYTLSWSAGNIFGVAFGPFLTVKFASLIFAYGILLTSFAITFLSVDLRRSGQLITLSTERCEQRSSALPHLNLLSDSRRMAELRLQYRLVLLVGGIVYTSVLAHFPKIITLEGLDLSNAGFLIVGANVGVFVTFLLLQRFHGWVGNEKVSTILLLTIPATGFLALLPGEPVLLFATALLAGASYAVPYTFAIFYGLLSEPEGHGKQGALHEMVIGILFGLGPLIGGTFLEYFSGKVGLTALSIVAYTVVIVVKLIVSKLSRLKKK